jgi:CDP-paratose 2-epimerase
MKVLITGGAGFVGSNLAKKFRAAGDSVVVLDNLRRRGSERNISELTKLGATFVHGDIRNSADLEDLPGTFDVMVEASAEPSVLAGLDGSPSYVLDTNLVGTLRCLEAARKKAKCLVFLSTSRVYSIDPLRAIPLQETESRFEISNTKSTIPGLSSRGVAEDFPVNLPRSLYGATKLASEYFVQEYFHTYKLSGVINRCGVIAGPGQFGKVDQGVFTLWVANHIYKKNLQYTGFGGTGKQVRDLLHPDDLYDLIRLQIDGKIPLQAQVYNVGGGREVSTSLKELTALCQKITGHEITLTSRPESTSVDIPLYISDSSLVEKTYGWKPKRNVETIVRGISDWISQNKESLKEIFG